MNETQKAIVAAVDARGYLDPWLAQQLAARQVVKLGEELAEVVPFVSGKHDMWAQLLEVSGEMCRRSFDAGFCGSIDHFNADGVSKELADMYVVMAVLLYALEEMSGHDIDLEALALQKATGDVARGVR